MLLVHLEDYGLVLLSLSGGVLGYLKDGYLAILGPRCDVLGALLDWLDVAALYSWALTAASLD